MHNPLQSFADFANQYLSKKPRKAVDMVNSMNENQLRYAMWAVLVLLFGHPETNAPDILFAPETLSPITPMSTVTFLVLAQAACPQATEEIKVFEDIVKKLNAQNN